MKIKDDILQDLRNGMFMREIRAKYRSQSQICEAVREFLDEIAEKTEEKRGVLRDTEARLNQTITEIERRETEKNELADEVAGLAAQIEELLPEVQSLKQEYDELFAGTEELRQRGFTTEIVSRLMAISDKDGAEIWAVLETHEKAQELGRDVDCLLDRKTGLEDDVAALEMKRKKVEDKLASERNRLDEVKRQVATFKEVVDTVSLFLKNGFTAKDLESLFYGLNAVGIRGNTGVSVRRLVDGLAKEKSLLELQGRVDSTGKRVAALERAEADTKANIEICRQKTLEAIEEEKTKAVETIVSAGVLTKGEISGVVSEFEVEMTAVADRIGGVVAERIRELGDLQEQKGKLQHLVEPAWVLTGVIQSPDYLVRVPPSLVINLLQNLAWWCEQKLPKVDVGASYDMIANEFRINEFIFPRFKISALIKLAGESIKKQTIESAGVGST